MYSRYFITADGGARGNGSADSHGYGPYQLLARTGQQWTVCLDFGQGVTNTARDAVL